MESLAIAAGHTLVVIHVSALMSGKMQVELLMTCDGEL